MDVENASERVIPTGNVVTTVHTHMPALPRKVRLDRSIEHTQKFDVYPEPTDLTTLSPIEFIIHETPNHYVDLSSFILDIKLKVYDAELERAGADWQRAGLYFINNIIQSLWTVIKVYLNNTNIESNYHVQQNSNLTQLLSTPNLIVKERGLPQGAFPILGNSMLAKVTEDHMTKDAIVERVNFTKENGIHIRGPLHLDLSTCERFLVDGVNMKIVLQPSSAQYVINSVAGMDYRYRIDSIKMQVGKIRVADGVFLQTSKYIISRPIEYMMRRSITHTEILPVGHSEMTISRPFQHLIPEIIYIYFVDQEAARGSYAYDPFFYGDMGLQSYSVKINGVQISGNDSLNEDYVTTYCDSLHAHGGDYFIPFKCYKNGCFVLCVNTNQGSDQNGVAIEKRGNLQITLRLKAPLARAHVVHVRGTLDSVFTIDGDRTISTEFQY